MRPALIVHLFHAEKSLLEHLLLPFCRIYGLKIAIWPPIPAAVAAAAAAAAGGGGVVLFEGL